MISLRTTLLALVSAVAVSAQDYYIEPSSVPLSTREVWCRNELSTCPLICQQTPPGTTLVNTCDPKTLTYGCVCGDGLQPNVSEYSLTLPFHVCQEWGVQCVKKCNANGLNNKCASQCQEDNPCGAQEPTKPNKTVKATNSATLSASSEPTVHSGLAGEGGGAAQGSAAVRAIQLGSSYGLAVVGITLFGGFALAL